MKATKPAKSLDLRDDVFVTLSEIAQRWRMTTKNARIRLRELGVRAIRLSAKSVFYKLSELIDVEEATRDKLPVANNPTQLDKYRAATKQKEHAAK